MPEAKYTTLTKNSFGKETAESMAKRKNQVKAHLLALRHQGPTYLALATAFSSLSPTAFSEFFRWNYPRYRQTKLFAGMRTFTASNVGKWVKSELSSPSEALRWVNAITEHFAADIAESAEYTISLEMTRHNYKEDKERILADFQFRPISLLNISSVLFCISKADGLDGQKRWMSENLFVKHGSFANALHYFKGVATEGGRDPLDVADVIYKSFVRRVQDDSLSRAIYDVVFGMPLDAEGFTNLVRYISYQSAVDQYEAAANLVSSNVLIDLDVPEQEQALFKEKMEAVDDWRIAAIRKLDQAAAKYSVYLPLHDSATQPIPNELTSDRLAGLEERDQRTLFADFYFSAPNTPAAYLASSHQVIRQADSIDGFLQGLSRREVAYAHYYRDSPIHRGRRRVPLSFDALSAALGGDVSGLERRELFKLACLVGIDEARAADVLRLLYSESKADRGATSFFPATTFFSKISEDEILEIAIDPRVAVALSKVKEFLGDEADQILYLTVEQFLREQNVVRPSELEVDSSVVEDFLYQACTTDCLGKSLEFDYDADIEEERLAILRNLEALHNEGQKLYEQEIHKIVGRQTVDELLQRYEVGKIHCDERAIQSWARDTIMAKFIRLRDHIESGLLPVEHASAEEFISHISAGKPGAFIFKVPSSEAFNIARSIVEELLDRYALDPRHGVDSYLSLGMRHGALIDHLRSPLSRHHMITTKGILGYERSEYWIQTFASGGDPDIGLEVSNAVAGFSAAYDAELTRIKDDLIQVRRGDKPAGIIDLEWKEPEILSFISIAANLSSFDRLLEEFSNFYWKIADVKLEPARRAIRGSIRAGLLAMISNMETDLARNTGFTRLGPFTDAAMRAKDELSAAIDDLALWHNIAKSTDIKPIALVDIISAAKKIVTRLHPQFDSDDFVSGDTHVTLTSSLNILIEVFKALYTNVCKHSEVDHPAISVRIDASQPNVLKVSFESSCADVELAEEAARVASERIATGEYESRLPTEGGSGLPKVARATVSDGRPNTRVWVDREAGNFCVEMKFSLVNL